MLASQAGGASLASRVSAASARCRADRATTTAPRKATIARGRRNRRKDKSRATTTVDDDDDDASAETTADALSDLASRGVDVDAATAAALDASARDMLARAGISADAVAAETRGDAVASSSSSSAPLPAVSRDDVLDSCVGTTAWMLAIGLIAREGTYFGQGVLPDAVPDLASALPLVAALHPPFPPSDLARDLGIAVGAAAAVTAARGALLRAWPVRVDRSNYNATDRRQPSLSSPCPVSAAPSVVLSLTSVVSSFIVRRRRRRVVVRTSRRRPTAATRRF